MSWGTCYAGSNNIHFNSPALMDDGRNYSSWQQDALCNDNIKKDANIKSNADYRKYLINNADKIIKINQYEACNNCGTYINLDNSREDNLGVTNTPYIFNNELSNNQPFGYENSDLKQLYLSREQLKVLKTTPMKIKQTFF